MQLINGFAPALNQTFQFLTSTGRRSGAFSNLSLPALGAGKAWQIVYSPHAVSLAVVAPRACSYGDYNQNGVVDAADYTLWRDSLGSTTKLGSRRQQQRCRSTLATSTFGKSISARRQVGEPRLAGLCPSLRASR